MVLDARSISKTERLILILGGMEINGFDPWRLFIFAREKLSIYGFESQDDLEKCFDVAVSEGHLVCSESSVFYVANVARAFAVDIDSRLPGDNLPARNLDIVLVLGSHYFQVAELMLENYDSLSKRWKKNNSLSHRKIVDLRIYMTSWLGFLAVTCEGFENIGMRLLIQNNRPSAFQKLIQKSDAIGKLIKGIVILFVSFEIRHFISGRVQRQSGASSIPMPIDFHGLANCTMHLQIFSLLIASNVNAITQKWTMG